MGILYSFEFIVLICGAVFNYRMAILEKAPGLLWSGLSIVATLFTWLVLGWGLIGIIVGQVALFILIWLVRAILGGKGRR